MTPAKPTPRKPEALFQDLAESAFEFLDRAIREFRDSPKFSTIHFATAVELFLKARLTREHWSLVLENPDKANRAQFLDGRCRTVTPGAAINRLQDLADVTISQDARTVFLAIAEHRNRMIHFVHGGGEGDGAKEILKQVAIEQCRGWSHLERLLRDWTDHFEWLAPRIAAVRLAMIGHHEFLTAAFDVLQPTIRSLKSKGAVFRICRSCAHEAAQVHKLSDHVARLECLLCWSRDSLITLECPSSLCDAQVELTGYDGLAPCKVCTASISAADVAKVLESDPPITADDMIDYVAKNCALCAGYHSVVAHGHHYVCTECLAVEDEIAFCESCCEMQMGGGKLEFSAYTGCEFCEGRQGGD